MAYFEYKKEHIHKVKTFEDLECHLNSMSSKHGDTYLYSLGYYMLTARRGGWVFEGFDTCAVVCLHPHKNNTYLVFPSLCEDMDKALRLTMMILERFNYAEAEVKLMRFTKEHMTRLRQLVNISQGTYSDYSFERTNDPDMDTNYPAHILSTSKVASLKGRDIKNVRSQYNKIDPQDIEFISLSDPKAIRYMKGVLKYWEGNRIAYQDNYTPDDSHYYQALFDLLSLKPHVFDGMITKYKGRLVGFSVWDIMNQDTANSLAHLIDINIRGLSEYIMVEICRKLHDMGINAFNRGGSEDKGVDYFKRKFAPIKSVDLGLYAVKRRHIFHGVDINILVPQENGQTRLQPFVM